MNSPSWPLPSNVKEFSSQVNQVATMVLNGQMAADQARLYATLVRTVVQASGLEMQRARLLKQAPDLGFDKPVDVTPPES